MDDRAANLGANGNSGTGWRRGLPSRTRLAALNRRSDARGAAQLGLHGAGLALTGAAVAQAAGSLWLIPAMALHGVVLVFLFAALHEAIHATAFRRRGLNRALAWGAGAVLILPPAYFRAFHFAHHRWTQNPDRDPELAQPKPATLGAYLLVVSGLPYWRERIATTLAHAFGRFEPTGFLPPAARGRIVAEARRLWALYAGIALAALAAESWAPVVFWLGPAVLGQPALRLFLLAEHTGRPLVADMLANSRTTRTNAILRRLAWNMPYHAEHHAFPSVPFHALPALHREIAPRIACVAPGYRAVHGEILRGLRRPRAGGGPSQR